ncbi:glycosyltransferase family 39 protein [Angustibacter aerolatus]
MTATLTSPPPAVDEAAPTPPRGRAVRLLRGPGGDPAWARPALLGLLALTGVLYLWDLSASGWANSFYAAAAQAGSASWKAFFYGSSDAANAITVDKPPASLWFMALSIRLFGLSSWSLLVPQALMGVATVAVLHATVKRVAGAAAGLLAGLVLALTPVAALMFRFDNPDALLVLVLTLGAWMTLRACERGRARWLVLAGAMVGLGFLTKQLQAFLVLPAFGLAYLVAAPKALGRRVLDLLLAFGAMVLAAGWWVAVVELVPASMRPYVGGSQSNSFLELTFGYNGLGRITGDETGSVGGGGATAGGGMWGTTGLGRMFDSENGGQASWLIPAALVLLVGGFWAVGRARRTDVRRAALVVWGGWLLVTLVTFSFMSGIFHAYYTVALAPAIAAVVGTGAALLWQRRRSLVAAGFLGAAAVAGSVWGFVLLGRSSDVVPWLRWPVLLLGLGAGAALVAPSALRGRWQQAVAAVAVVASLAGPAAYTVDTVTTPHTGSIVTAGPSVAGGGFGGGMRGGPGGGGGVGGPPGLAQGATGTGTRPAGGPGGGGGGGGLLTGSTSSAELTAALQADASSYTWVAAAVGSNTASGYQLASQEPVMAIGGFNGSDPAPTLAQFQAYVAAGEIHWVIGSGGGGLGQQNGGSSASSEIASWVAASFTAQTIGGTTVYDLTQGATDGSTTA